jgi:nucleotide-binding universal stress UspA family protein
MNDETHARILVATDLSQPGRAAVRAGALLAQRSDASVTLMTVVQALPVPVPETLGRGEEVERELQRRAREELAELRDEELGRNTNVSLLDVVHPSPAAAIVEASRATGADTVVVAHQGKGAVERLLYGSVTEKVVRHAPCSVLCVKRVPKPGARPFARVLVAVDFSDEAPNACRVAARWARAFGSSVHLLHIASFVDVTILATVGASGGAELEDYQSEIVASAERDLAALRREHFAGIDRVTHEVVVDPSPPLAICQRAERDVDLVVVGSRGAGAVAHFFMGSVAERVVRHARVDVLVARSES